MNRTISLVCILTNESTIYFPSTGSIPRPGEVSSCTKQSLLLKDEKRADFTRIRVVMPAVSSLESQ